MSRRKADRRGRARRIHVFTRDSQISGWWLVIALLAVTGLAAMFTISNGPPSAAAAATSDTRWEPSWPPLPESRYAPPRSMGEVRAAYAFAARRPDVLRHIPCYCGCERENHRSNLDCYIAGRTASGAPKWDDHAFT
jgi:hypothetical protein